MALLFITLSAELKCRARTDSSRPAATAVVIDELSLHEPLIANLDTDESQSVDLYIGIPRSARRWENRQAGGDDFVTFSL